nr:hypothetical protein Iba_chr02fCG5850 [Ipomoea batatas]
MAITTFSLLLFVANSKEWLVELFYKNNNKPLLVGFTEHLLGLEILPLLENHGADVLGGSGSGISIAVGPVGGLPKLQTVIMRTYVRQL